ncbi:MAG: CAP domain-containing protein [Flavobacteriales bacterium]|nr:CAP domain-containing protein [Flavobacteriales bacterium]MCB9198008.1 CAP domain-containing protein [Flavobacteriales bacterium]
MRKVVFGNTRKFNLIILAIILMIISTSKVEAQILNFDLAKLRKEWGAAEFRKANTTKFAFYMGRSQKRTILYMNLARQDGVKFRELVIAPYIEKHPDKKSFDVSLNSKNLQPLKPSFTLWMAALPHAIISGIVASEGHQGFDVRMAMTLNLDQTGENCSYGYFKGLDVTLQLLNSPPHKANILEPDFYRAAVSKFIHFEYGWNSVTTFSGAKYRDMLFRNAYQNANWFIGIGLQSNFHQFMTEFTFGAKYVNNVTSSRWSVGSQLYFYQNNSYLMPTVKLESSWYYINLGINLQGGLADSKFFGIVRPELSVYFPFSISRGGYEYLNFDNNKSSIGIGYGYNIPVYNSSILPGYIYPHTIELKWRRNFGFVDKKTKNHH